MKVSQTMKQGLTGFLIRVSHTLISLFVLSGVSECPGGGAREPPRVTNSTSVVTYIFVQSGSGEATQAGFTIKSHNTRSKLLPVSH